MVAFLDVSNLHASYGPTRVLHGIDFAMDEGTITTLLGANGAGKTTTLRALCGMVKTQGEVKFAGERIDGKATPAVQRRSTGAIRRRRSGACLPCAREPQAAARWTMPGSHR
jgi:branched-chain amino acid transport system ATP-binding protein